MSVPEGEEMPTLEERVAVLESRVEDLAVRTDHAVDLGVVAAREALTAREAHQKNIELLNALRKTQAEHTQILAEHTGMHAEHTRRFDAIEATLGQHDQRLDDIQGKLGTLTLGMHTIETLLRRLTDDDAPQ